MPTEKWLGKIVENIIWKYSHLGILWRAHPICSPRLTKSRKLPPGNTGVKKAPRSNTGRWDPNGLRWPARVTRSGNRRWFQRARPHRAVSLQARRKARRLQARQAANPKTSWPIERPHTKTDWEVERPHARASGVTPCAQEWTSRGIWQHRRALCSSPIRAYKERPCKGCACGRK